MPSNGIMIRTPLVARYALVGALVLIPTACTSTRPVETVVRDKAPAAAQAEVQRIIIARTLGL